MKTVIEQLPNISKDSEVLMFYKFRCVEHYPYVNSQYLNKTFAEVLNRLGIFFPDNYNYMALRDDVNHITTTVKEYGNYQYIINYKHLLLS